jgi:hypothetical protein
MAIHFGVSLPQIKRTWDETKAAAQEFESLGYDSVWVVDHLYGIPGPQIPIFEAWTTLAAVGAVISATASWGRLKSALRRCADTSPPAAPCSSSSSSAVTPVARRACSPRR